MSRKEAVIRLALILLTISFLSAPICSLGQEDSQPKARLIRSRFGGGDVGHYTQEVALIFGDYKNDPDVLAAIRICSKDPMPLALNTAGASPFLMEHYLTDFYNYSRERILFLRSEDCLSSEPAPVITESWLVPKGAVLPSSIESVKSCQVSLESVPEETEKDEDINNASEYLAALRVFAEKLKSRPEAVGIAVGGYFVDTSTRVNARRYNRARAVMRQRLGEAQRFLEQAGLPHDRYFTRVHPWVTLCYPESCNPQPKFPKLRIIEIRKACEVKTTAASNNSFNRSANSAAFIARLECLMRFVAPG